MKGPAARRLFYGRGFLLVVLVAVGLYAVLSIRATQESLEQAAQTGGEAVSEMKTYAAGINDGASSYVETDDPAYREEVEEAQAGFEEARPATTAWPALTGGESRSAPSTKSTRPWARP